jgi:hypothetical protein
MGIEARTTRGGELVFYCPKKKCVSVIKTIFVFSATIFAVIVSLNAIFGMLVIDFSKTAIISIIRCSSPSTEILSLPFFRVYNIYGI